MGPRNVKNSASGGKVFARGCARESVPEKPAGSPKNTRATPHRSETNEIAARAVRRVEEGTFAVLLQSGLGDEWWADSMECYCCLRKIQDKLCDGKTPHERRFGMPFNRPVIPFGAMVECHPVSAKDQSGLHEFGTKVLPGIFLGYALYAGGIWKGDIVVADIEEL